MTLDKAILAALAVSIDVTGYLRILNQSHWTTPTGMGQGATRFSSPTNSFRLLYAAQNLQTALAEAIIRDRFQGKQKRVLTEGDIASFVIASMVSRAPLTLLDLRTSGASRLGVATNAVRARAQQAGRRLSQTLYDSTNFDGIVYHSRITNGECVAVYDRAADRVLDPNCPVVDLVRLADLTSALRSLDVALIGRP